MCATPADHHSKLTRRNRIHRRHWWAWIALCAALAIHIADEALTDFLSVYNPAVVALRESNPSLPLPTFAFDTWLSLLIFAVLALTASSYFVRKGRWAMRPISYVFAGFMLLNGLLHIAVSLYMGKLISGVYSSPLLLAASVALIIATRAHNAEPGGSMTHLLALLISLALFAGTTHAQQSTTKPEDAETAALREKAFSLLESIAGQLGTLQSAENRARLGANIADSLWRHDENRAREVLQMVQTDIKSELDKFEPGISNDMHASVFLKLRADTVERIARHDGEAALTFLQATKPSFKNENEYEAHFSAGIELRLAQRVVADNPEAAVILGREVMEKEFPYELLSVLRKLNRKHRDSAQVLYRDMVRKLRDADLVGDWSARHFAGNLANSFQPPAANESTYRELIAILVNNALKIRCDDPPTSEDNVINYCQWLSTVPQIQTVDARASRLKRWFSNDRNYVPHSPALSEMSDLLSEGSTEEIMAFASRHPELAQQMFWYYADRLVRRGDLETARKIATTYLTDPEKRRNLFAYLERAEKKFEINEAMLAEMEQALEKISQPVQRARFLLENAHRFGSVDRKAALKLLGRASDIIETLKPGKDATEAQLVLAVMYCYENSDRGMAMMESLAPRLNELVELAAKLDGYDTNYLRDGEWNMSANGSVGQLLTILSRSAAPFAWYDFDRAVSLASRFDRPEIRMMAHVKLAQGILAGPLKRFPRLGARD